ncbi:hypothetical protein LIER_00506 [Lithospermum erythrorhizon]|uniref:Retrotransposon gag domain-containing protein n=1 Tax=Lithospermum erythrorhizon TaxID=34254 RepID=A0AAV3NHN3_LITER
MDEKVSMITFFHGLQFRPLKERLVLEPVANITKKPKKRQFPSGGQRGRSPRRENGRVRQLQEPVHTSYTPLRTSTRKVYAQMDDGKLFPKPQKLRSHSNRRDLKLFCEYHKDHGHDTNDCRVLKAEIEKLIRRGHLTDFVRERSPKSLWDSPRRNVKPRSQSPPRVTGLIDTISGGLAGGGDTSNSRK